MKQQLLIIYFVILSLTGYSQNTGVSISPANTPADPSAILDVNSTTQGTLITRMTQAQRNAIVNPALGLLIFNTSTNCINMWLGSNWKQICGECDFSNPVPGNSGPVCFGQTLNLTATSISGATYQWAGPNGFTSTQQNPSISNTTAAASGSYSVTATLNGCTSAPQTTVAIVNPTPATPIAGSNGPLCAGQTLNLTASNVASAGYSWTGPNSFTSTLQNLSISNVQVANAGDYSVVAVLNGCSSAVAVTTVAVSDVPATPGSISGPSTVMSSSSGIVYSISTVNGATSYTWTVPSGSSITAGGGTTSITVTFGGTGTGNISVLASNFCGSSSSSSSLPVTINPAIISFTTAGTVSWTAPAGISSVEVLVVAGGGQGGGCASGGGAGGLIYNASYSVTPLQNYTVTVGAGGTGGVCSNGGTNGDNSVFGTLIAIGGGGGGSGNQGGKSGGSGGGASWNGGVLPGGSGTPGQGNAGGNNNINQPPYPGGGGGGAGGVGGTPSSNTVAGNGGPGLQYSISGAPVYYAGGGGGGGYPACNAGSGGIGGGGNGGTTVNGSPGTPNTGGGGGGGDNDNGYLGGNGGSGIVILRY